MANSSIPTSVTIANGAAASSTFSLGIRQWGCFQIPSAFTGATVTVKGSLDGVTFTTILPTNSDNGQSVAANGTYQLPVNAVNFPFLQLVSASNEAAARTIPIFLRG